MQEYKLPIRTLLLWQIRAALCWVLFSAVFAYYCFALKIFLGFFIALTVVFLITEFWYLPKFISGCKIKCSGESVVIEKGVILKNTHILPFSRLIYTQTFTTPLAKVFGLTALTLKAARSRIFVPEISLDDAKYIIAMQSRGDGS